MRAARAFAGERHFRLEALPIPEPGPGEVLIPGRTLTEYLRPCV